MSIPRTWWWLALTGVAISALLPWIAQRLRDDVGNRCALDGGNVTPEHAVCVLTQQERSWFCSLYCAEKWLARSEFQPSEILVTDEATGSLLDARSAFYVRSRVLSHPPTREYRHVFSSHEQAKQHAEDHFGRILEGVERPLGGWTQGRRNPAAAGSVDGNSDENDLTP